MNLHPVVILAGGLATRLRPITEKIPKSLVEVGRQPFIGQQLRLLYSQSIRRVIIAAWYRGEMIREAVGDGEQFGLRVEYVFDGETPLGTGGAIRKAASLLNGPFFVLYGDSYLPCDYVDIQTHFDHQNQPALMTIHRNLDSWDTSNVEMANGQILRYDKKTHTPRMEFIDYGLGVFQPKVFGSLAEGQAADLADIYHNLAVRHELAAYEVKQRFYQVGSFEGLRELDQLLADNPDQFLRKENP